MIEPGSGPNEKGKYDDNDWTDDSSGNEEISDLYDSRSDYSSSDFEDSFEKPEIEEEEAIDEEKIK